MKRNDLNLLIFLATVLISVSCGGGGNGEDATEDADPPQETDGMDARDGTDGTDPDTAESENPADVPAEDAPSDQTEQTEQEEDAPPDMAEDAVNDPLEEDAEEDLAEEPEPTPVCGNGSIEGSETCDDANTVTEPCGGGTDCTADCSLLEAACGDSSIDAGETCDDGDGDSMNACTTSCTANDHGIGAPCTCTGGGCSDTNFTAGPINGCSGVTIPSGTGGVLGCLRSIHEPISGYDTYYAEGYCTIMAVTCSGSLCGFVPQPGDFDTIACPTGYYLYLDERTVMGSTTVTSRSCLKTCTSDADCRWNADDAFWSACGAYMCLPAPADPSTFVCADSRMLGP